MTKISGGEMEFHSSDGKFAARSGMVPPWLKDEPEVLACLHRVLDKLEKTTATKPRLRVRAEEFPLLFSGGEQADQTWSLLKSLAHDYRLFDVRLVPEKDRVFDPEYFGAWLQLNRDREDLLRNWLNRPHKESVMLQWLTAIERRAHHFAGPLERLKTSVVTIAGRSADEVVEAFTRIGTFTRPLSLRQLSAQVFWGDSKILDNREELVRELFPDFSIVIRPIMVNVCLPEVVRGVLFIENQESYANAVDGMVPDAAGLALVYSSGFQGSAERIRQREGARLHYAATEENGQRQPFERWWFKNEAEAWPLYFWGDLDFSGMAILAALRRRFGAVVAWQPGYAPLLELLEHGGGHSPEAAAKQRQNHPVLTGCSYADSVLIPALESRVRFVDQEALF